MKKLLSVISMVMFLVVGAFAQAPEDLSFLTNRASLASWSLKQVDTIQVYLMQSAVGSPDSVYMSDSHTLAYSGPPSFTAIAKSLKGLTLTTAKTPVPGSLTTVFVSLQNILPDGKTQELFSGGASGEAVYDGQNWVLPKDASEPSMYMSYSIFIPAPGLLKAWVVETNQWGWAMKKSLQVWQGEGFYFEGTLSGQAYLCLEFADQQTGEITDWVYNLQGNGRRAPLSSVIAAVSIRDSEDVRDFGDNTNQLTHWLYTYKSDYSSLTYGKVPLLVANYTTNTTVTLWVGSAVGYASSFSVTRVADNIIPTNTQFRLDVPGGTGAIITTFKPGLYHIVPLGIDVCPDWWKITEVYGWGGIGKG